MSNENRTKTYAIIAIVIIAIAAVTAGAWWAGWLSPAPEEEKKTITIGTTGCFTGSMTAEGKEGLEGLTLAIEEINAEGGLLGHYIKVVSYDIGDFDPSMASSAAEKLCTQDKVTAAFSSGSTTLTDFEAEIYNDYGIPYFIAVNPFQLLNVVNEGGGGENFPYTFCGMPMYFGYMLDLPVNLDEWEKDGLVDLPTRTAAVVASDNPYSRTIAEGLKGNLTAKGWTIVVDEMVALGTILEWGPILAKIRTANPDLIINTDYNPANEAAFVKQFLESPTDSIMFLQYGPSLAEFIEILGDDANGILWDYIGVIASDQWWAYSDVANAFEKRFGYKPMGYGLFDYWLVQWWAKGVEKAGSFDAEEVSAACESITMESCGGKWSIDPETRIVKYGPGYVETIFFQIQNQKHVLVAPSKYEEGKFQTPPWFK